MTGFGAGFIDYDNDGDLDIYVVIDIRSIHEPRPWFMRNLLYRNDGATATGWHFEEVAVSAGADASIDGMGLAVGDFDLNGTLDLYMSHGGPSVFLKNRGDGTFQDAGAATGTDFPTRGWGTCFADFDLDGWPDLYLGSQTDPNRVFHNAADGTFTDVSATSGADDTRITIGVAYADYDKDGDLDLVLGNSGTGYHVFRNKRNPLPSEWVGLRLHGAGPIHRNAIGTRATLVLNDGRRLMQEVKSGSSLGSGNDMALRWGFGGATPVRIELKWTDGKTETLDALALGTEMQHTYPTGD
jgi:hypothetical protein